MSIKNGILLLILLIALFFRVYRLDSVPPSASLDEVSLGYNAYSIEKTGADEYGYKFPILLRAYDDFRPALYTYLIVPLLPIFGLSAAAVRLPSVILGLVTILFVYLAAEELFSKSDASSKWGRWIPPATAFFLAISPWHIYITRLGHEANLGIALSVAGVYFFIRWARSDRHLALFFSFVFFALSLYGYQSQKIITPLWLGALLFFYRTRIWNAKKVTLQSGVVAIALLIPFFFVSFSPSGLARFTGTSVFRFHPLFLQTEEKLIGARQANDIVKKIIYQPSVTAVRIFIDNYTRHLKPEWLFTGKLHEAHKVPFTGLLYWWDGIFAIAGIYFLTQEKKRKEAVLFSILILSSFLPGALTTQAPHAMRSYTAVPFWLLLSGIGFVGLTKLFQGTSKAIFVSGAGLLLFYGATKLFVNYFTVFPVAASGSFQYALHDGIQYIMNHEREYDQIVVSNEDQLYQSYMFYLYHKKYDPVAYQALGGTGSGGYEVIHRIGNIEFRPIQWEKDKELKHTLVVGNPTDFPKDVSTIHKSMFLDGSVGTVAVAL